MLTKLQTFSRQGKSQPVTAESSLKDRRVFSHRVKREKTGQPAPEALREIPEHKRVDLKAGTAKVLINLDSLQLKLSEGQLPNLEFGEDGLCSLSGGKYHIRRLDYGGRQYGERGEVWYCGQHIGNILWDARMPTLSGTAKYEIENSQLYDTVNADLWQSELIGNFVAAIGSEVEDIPLRVDGAIDGPAILEFMARVERREIIPKRLKTWEKSKGVVSMATGRLETFTFGSRKSGRYFRCYNKSLELREKHGDGQKDYIKDFWVANGLIKEMKVKMAGEEKRVSPNVGRLEVELRRKHLRTVKGLKYTDLFDRAKLAKLFECAMENYFEWVPADHPDSKINRRPTVEIIDFSEVKTEGYTRQKPVKRENPRMDKVLTRKLIKLAHKAQDIDTAVTYLKAAKEISRDIVIDFWLRKRSEEIAQELRRESILRKYTPNEIFELSEGDLSEFTRQVSREFENIYVGAV